jgi:hypothetical protein
MNVTTDVAAVTDMALPLIVDELTADWLTHALGLQYAGVEVLGMAIEDVMHGASTKFRVRTEYNECGMDAGLPAKLIVKGGFEDHSSIEANAQMYRREMRYYRDVATFLQMRAPKCYYAGRDPDTYQSIVIIEDLTLRGVEFYNAYKTQTYEQVAKRLDAMARYHAQTWESAEFAKGGRLAWVPKRCGSPHFRKRAEHYLSEDVWQSFMELPRGAAAPKPLRDVSWMRGALGKLAVAHEEVPNCLIHGDSHLGNVYEEADGTPGFFDPQIARAPWSVEVSYHMVGALEVADRRRWERPLLAHYLGRLEAYGVDVPPYEEAWDAYCRDIAHGLYIWLVNESVFQEEKINTANATRFGMAAIDCDTLGRLSG